jgi:esterase/lipase superfamily enzyme
MPSRPLAGRLRTVSWEGPKELSLRERCRGGPVRPKPIETPPDTLRRSRRIILLIHGFNVDFCAAEKSYIAFVRELFFQWTARTVWVYWPGDAAPESEGVFSRLARSVISPLSYPYQPDRAELAARYLADYIGEVIERRRTSALNPIHLSIVAHSLGCRLALELLSRLSAAVRAHMLKIELTVLMAAARLFEV